MRVLLIAPNGMLGRAWKQLLEAQAIDHQAVARPDLDLADPRSIHSAVTADFTHVVNAAAWTDVDGAEEHEARATQINGDAVAELAKACKTRDAQLIHYSTDYVFNGQATSPYPIDSPRDPVNAYGRSKAAGETAIEASGARHLTLRTSWVYAPWGKNFVLTIRKLAGERDVLQVVADQRGRPTSAQHLAKASLDLMRAKAEGYLHVTDGGEATWHDLAVHVAERSHSPCKILPCTTDTFPRPAKRPAYSVLDLAPTEAIIGPMPSWRDNVTAVMKQL
ncbi:dTDP-4-dehydrorhamnose reductase [Mucisphaera sp.]|uniref:dTDP-4-dehydrorhamnose reductase n=1 Tax=Mucisphaera sp. TaxID=2913024 RepID=UPI003D130761